ncbi:hypothetical protein P9112_011213 [Eukaryota sp. TZLM1-RC]
MPLIKSTKDINPCVVQAQYAVRGAVPIRATEIEADLRNKKGNHPFENIVYCNIGNPQALQQPPLTFPRQVLTLVMMPDLIEHCPDFFPIDVVDRARRILDSFPGYSGAYTHSQGALTVRKSVQQFIKEKDGVTADVNNIFLTDGASGGVSKLLQLLIRGPNDGIMIPIPQYPLYSATIVLNDGKIVPYHLDENRSWGLNLDELKRNYEEATAEGINVRAIAVINPGNPTGAVLSRNQIVELLHFASENDLVLMSDEVYRDNIYSSQQPFYSFLQVCHEEQIDVELASFHSASKGFFGECGIRGGYMYLHNFTELARSMLYKVASIGLCPNIAGQVIMDTIVNPPKEGEESYPLWEKEKSERLNSLQRRANKISKELNKLDGVSCQNVAGALYAFPCIDIPPKAVETAESQGKSPDLFYCLQLLETVGLCVVPGTGFGMKDEDGYHFRTTILPGEDVFDDVLQRFAKFHNDFVTLYK